jgi:hypothetical protein
MQIRNRRWFIFFPQAFAAKTEISTKRTSRLRLLWHRRVCPSATRDESNTAMSKTSSIKYITSKSVVKFPKMKTIKNPIPPCGGIGLRSDILCVAYFTRSIFFVWTNVRCPLDDASRR